MSTTRTVYLTHAAGIRSRAFALFRQCWKPILLAAVITGMFSLISSVLSYRGTQLGAAASEAVKADFYAQAPAAKGTAEYTEWAYFKESVMIDEAEAAAGRARLPWQAASIAVDVLGWIVGTFVMLGLNRGLLSALRGGQCTVGDLLGGRKGYPRALWTGVVVVLRMFGYMLLVVLLAVFLSAALSAIGLIIAGVGIAVFIIWLDLRYMLTHLHIAEDAEGAFSASDYIRSSVEDVKYFSMWRIIGVVWPYWLLSTAFALPALLSGRFPALATVALAIDVPGNIVLSMLQTVLTACIYEAIRYELNAPAPQPSDGAARAKALAAGEEE